MSNFDIDAELRNLLKVEREKVPFYIESLEDEMNQLIAAFQDHVDNMNSSQNDTFSEDSLQENEYDLLNELTQQDVNFYEAPRVGELQVSGNGAYAIGFKGDDFPVQELAEGETIRGTLDKYSVIPLMSDDTSDLEKRLSKPVLCVTLSDASVYDEGGKSMYSSERILVPLSIFNLKFGKVMRQFTETVAKAEPHYVAEAVELITEPKEPNVRELLSGIHFQQRCNEIENDLYYNGYDEVEDLQEARRQYQEELNSFVSEIEPDDQLVITVLEAMKIMGGTTDIYSQLAYYNGPVIIKFSNVWRVVHGFTVCSDDGGIQEMIHVLPETIKAALRAA